MVATIARRMKQKCRARRVEEQSMKGIRLIAHVNRGRRRWRLQACKCFLGKENDQFPTSLCKGGTMHLAG